MPIALVGFVVALAAIAIGSRSSDLRAGVGLVPACLSYVALRFTVDLVPQAGMIAATVARGADGYVNRVRGFEDHLSFTALGGPAVVMAVLSLLWSWRRVGGIGRVLAAVVIPLGWFALLPVVTPAVSAGPIAAFSRGAYHGLFWLGVGGVVGAVLPAHCERQDRNRLKAGLQRVSAQALAGVPPSGGPEDHPLPPEGGTPAGSLVECQPSGGRDNHPPPEGGTPAGSPLPRRLPLAIAGFAAVFAGVCLVGTGMIGPAGGRSIRVHNYGGLDWERPVFGQFGAFSGGMFGLLPVYCRAEGYDFDVIDHEESTGSDGASAAWKDTIAAGLRALADRLAQFVRSLPRKSAQRTLPGPPFAETADKVAW